MPADSEKGSVIVTDPDILGGSFPVFRGTRVPVDTFLNHIKDGGTPPKGLLKQAVAFACV